MSLQAPASARRRARARVDGTVQGVGFRPHVYRLAAELCLSGFVYNDSRGVLLEVEGDATAVRDFLKRLESEAPPLAVLERLVIEEREPTGEQGFVIRASPLTGVANAPVTPDSATCAECLAELFEASDRRHRYPFINCTNCGPRFTIVRGVPYDRPQTTMGAFTMCRRCQAEYDDPRDRRFHAQPNACPECGPRVTLRAADGGVPSDDQDDALLAAALALERGAILAVKGIGGYHLACRADDELAVSALRDRKHREDKPFAVMARSLEQAQQLVELGALERELLRGPERPIVLAPRRFEAAVAPSVAPGAPELGVMLAYSPLHHILLDDLARLTAGEGHDVALVMTSGNTSDEPIAFTDDDAQERLGGIADLFLVHDRAIRTRTDDSVVRGVKLGERRRAAFIRRSRGHVPASIPLGGGTPSPLLACGAEQKNTFCLGKDERAWVSHHIGDLENFETLRSFTDGIEHFERLFAVEPEVVAHDLHPEYLSTKYALERECELVGVQHHHAHLASCLAEHGESGPALGAIFDGTGYGIDGTIWGGEFLYGDLLGARRVGALMQVRLPGGARAVREPWRMACVWLAAAEGGGDPPLPPALAGEVQEREWRQVLSIAQAGVASPITSSMGRLFDAVAAICGLRARVSYEGQAAIELEAACAPAAGEPYPISVRDDDGMLTLDPCETVAAVAREIAAGESPGVVAGRFHGAIASATVIACTRAAAAAGTELAVLSGGVFQNRRLIEQVASGLLKAGMRVLTPELLPANDGGIAFGQAAVAAALLRARAG